MITCICTTFSILPLYPTKGNAAMHIESIEANQGRSFLASIGYPPSNPLTHKVRFSFHVIPRLPEMPKEFPNHLLSMGSYTHIFKIWIKRVEKNGALPHHEGLHKRASLGSPVACRSPVASPPCLRHSDIWLSLSLRHATLHKLQPKSQGVRPKRLGHSESTPIRPTLLRRS